MFLNVPNTTFTTVQILSSELISLMSEGKFGMLYDRQPEETKDEPPVLGPSPLPKVVRQSISMIFLHSIKLQKCKSFVSGHLQLSGHVCYWPEQS